MTAAATDAPSGLGRITNEVLERVARFGTRRPIALATQAGTRCEAWARGVLGTWTEQIAAVSGTATRRSVDRLAERLSALDYRVEELERSTTSDSADA